MGSNRTLDLIIEDWEMTQTETETVTEATDDVGSGQGMTDSPDPAMHIPVFAACAALIIAVVSTVLITSKKKKAQ